MKTIQKLLLTLTLLVAITTALRAQTITTLVSFASAPNGIQPVAGVAVGPDGNFYGTTPNGGSSGDGTVFRLTTNGVLTTLVNFTGANGVGPRSALTLGPDGNFYGTANTGGSGGQGVVFRVTTNGTLTLLASFNRVGTNGGYPYGTLVMGPDGDFYGTTVAGGGSTDDGTVYRVSTNGVFTTLISFNGPNGAAPEAGLTLGLDGNLYGVTSGGGSSSDGTMFRITTNGVFTTLVSFAGANGKNPFSGLTLGPDGNFYGATYTGGSSGYGTVFYVTTNGALTTLASFNGSNGQYPYAVLTLGADGNLYGTTTAGGSTGNGTLYRVTTNGVLTTLASFASTNGANPSGALALGWDGRYYGTTSGGGSSGNGTVFSFALLPVPSVTGVNWSGTNLIVHASWQNAGTYVMLASTNLLLPMSQWTPVTTNVLGASGNFTTTNPVNPNVPDLFFRLSAQ